MSESAILGGGLGENSSNLGKQTALAEKLTVVEAENELIRRAEDIENESKKIEEMMGIGAEEIMSAYEAITPEYARDIVEKTIERIPMGFMKGTLWTVDNLREIGGMVMLWASMKAPENAVMVAASVMILTIGTENATEENSDGNADGAVPVRMEEVSVSKEDAVGEEELSESPADIGSFFKFDDMDDQNQIRGEEISGSPVDMEAMPGNDNESLLEVLGDEEMEGFKFTEPIGMFEEPVQTESLETKEVIDSKKPMHSSLLHRIMTVGMGRFVNQFNQ